MIREFDEIEGWHLDGARSCAQWLAWRTGLAPGAARERVRVARALAPLPRLSDAMRRGRLSYSAARALTRVATPENEEELVDLARHTTAAQLERMVQGWQGLDRASEAEGARARHEQRGVSLLPDADGSWDLRGRLDADVGADADRALDLAERILFAGGALDADATPRQRRADAFALLIESARMGLDALSADGAAGGRLDAEGATGGEAMSAEDPTAAAPREEATRTAVSGRSSRFQVVVHVSAETLREATPGGPEPGESRIEGGPRVSAETSRRLACDAGVVRMRHDEDGKALDIGRRTRSVPPAIRRALERRDGGCRFPGCTLSICDAHHVRHWADGGETSLDNLVLLCRWHHRRVHEDGWRIERDSGDGLRFKRPDGRRLPEIPPRQEWADDPADALEREQRDLGIDPWTPTTDWLGDPLDVDWALFTLWRPRAPGHV